MENIKDSTGNNTTCVMAQIMFYENNEEKPKKVYKVLSCVVYSLVDYYVWIDYIVKIKIIKLHFFRTNI